MAKNVRFLESSLTCHCHHKHYQPDKNSQRIISCDLALPHRTITETNSKRVNCQFTTVSFPALGNHRNHKPPGWNSVGITQRAQRSKKVEISSEIVKISRERNVRASPPPRPYFCGEIETSRLKIRTAKSTHHPHKIDNQHRECKTGGGAYFAFFLASDNSHTTPPKIPPDEEGLLWGVVRGWRQKSFKNPLPLKPGILVKNRSF